MEEPRKLTEEEIQDILNVIPNIKSCADTVSNDNTKSLKNLFREQLQTIVLTPLGIQDLKSDIVRQYRETVVRPGTMIGITASESLGKNTTQSALNSFHSSGSAKNVSHGVERISELINASQDTKKPSCTIFFKDDFLSFDDIISKKRSEITEITVQRLVIGIPNIDSSDDFEEPEWYDLYRKMVRNDFQASHVLRLDIDVNLLYSYKITMQEICSAIEKGGSVVCVYSPMSVGKIDIYPIEKEINSILSSSGLISYENSSLIFLSKIIIPFLDKLKISGITGIQQIYPVNAPVLQIVKEEKKEVLTKEEKEGLTKDIKEKKPIWFLVLNTVRMKITGINVEKLVKLCEVANMKVLKVRPNYIAVESEISPRKVILDLIDKDKKEEKEFQDRIKKEREKSKTWKVIIRNPTPIEIHSKIVYADSTGSNLTELLNDPRIDSTRTFCNNVHEIKQAFGIEAARNFLIKEFIDVFGTEGYINPRHIVLLADYMTSLGEVYGVTFTGASRQPIGSLEKASYEKAMDVFKEASGFGEEKSVSGTSASVFIGKTALVGTGYSKDYIKPENLERYNLTRKELLKDPNMVLNAESFNDAVKEFIVGGEAFLESQSLESLEEMMFASAPSAPSIPGKEKTAQITEVTEVTQISEVSISQNYVVKGETTRGLELNEALEDLEEEMFSQVTCTKLKMPETSITSGGVTKTLPSLVPSITPLALPRFPKPKPQGVKIFNLEEFLK